MIRWVNLCVVCQRRRPVLAEFVEKANFYVISNEKDRRSFGVPHFPSFRNLPGGVFVIAIATLIQENFQARDRTRHVILGKRE